MGHPVRPWSLAYIFCTLQGSPVIRSRLDRGTPDLRTALALLQLEGARVELVVGALLRNEVVVRATFDGTTVIEHDDHV